MKLILILLLIPITSFSQFTETKGDTTIVGSFKDDLKNAPFSLKIVEKGYKMSFCTQRFTNSESCMVDVIFNESRESMSEFYNFVSNLFESEKGFVTKYLETEQYKITVSKSGNFIGLTFDFKFVVNNVRNHREVTSIFSSVNWESLFKNL